MRVRSDRAGARAMLGRAFESAQARSMPTFELWVELGTLETDARNLAAARLAYDKALADAPGFRPALLGAVPGDATLQRLLGQALKFAGRVGASLLTYAGLPDLIASDLDDYRWRLVELVVNPQLLREYAAHLDRERNTLPLSDTRGFAAEFERLLEFAYGEVTSA